MTDNRVTLDIPSARGTVELEGAERVFYKVLIDGEVIKRKRGGWAIPLRKGDTGKLESRGILPGFQSLVMGDKVIYRMGAHASGIEKALMFLPFVLIFFLFPGMVLALVLFFMNVLAVKNDQMPRGARMTLPVVNTIAGFVILGLLSGLIG